MLPEYSWRVVSSVILIVTLSLPARANRLDTDVHWIVAGIVVASVGVGVLTAALIVHHNKRSSITGCVVSEPNGFSLTDAKDGKTYALTGENSAVKAGDQMTLQGKRKKSGGKPIFETQSVMRDLGACKP